MKIYKDIVSGDELLNDTYNIKLVDDVAYRVVAKHISMNRVGDFDIGANPSAEGGVGDEDVDCSADMVSGLDLVLHMRLTETGFADKKAFLSYLKDYMKQITTRLEKDAPAEVDKFKNGVNGFIKSKLSSFKDMQFFQGESMDPEAMTAILLYEDVDGSESPVFYFFKHGLEEEKV